MRHTILIVDDDITTLKIIRMVLQRQGYTVIYATTGPEALRKVEEHQPDLVLLDIVLPGMDGFQVCQYVRQTANLAHTSIIMFSGLDRPADQRLAFEAGSDDYITKPVSTTDLLEKVRSVLYFK